MKCPGQDSRYWKPGAIFDVKCPHCGTMIEFFKDDTRRKCPSCGQDVPNPEMDFGCAAYCPYAEHCLGPEGAAAAREGKLTMLKENMVKEIQGLYHADKGKLSEAVNFLELCEDIGKREGADLGLVLIAGFAMLLISGRSPDHAGQDATKQLLEKLVKTGIDEQQARDALELIEKDLSGQLADSKKKQDINVIRDAMILSRSQAKGKTDWSGMTEQLVTDSARQMAANKAAIGG